VKALPKRWFGVCAAALSLGAPAHADTVKLNLLSSGAMPKLGGYRPQRLALTAQKPASLKKAPADLAAPRYGVLTLGPRESPSSVVVVVDEPEGKDARLFVDANGNGDLTDDPAAQWIKSAYQDRDGKALTRYRGGADVQIRYGGETVPVRLAMYRFDKADTARAVLKDTLLYYRDYAREGEMALGGKTYKVMLSDDTATGDFRGKPGGPSSGVRLLIDVNGNGAFDPRGESFDVAKPFNIGGTTYEITGLTASGDAFSVGKSARAVAEILPPPDLGPGKKAVAFEAKTTDGKTIRFPESYKGKVVLLDFWATWCGPCIAELPHLTKAYETLHAQGFEVLGISLDRENWGEKLAAFCREKKMPWPQVYDGKYWNAEVAQRYGVTSIPRAYLVDGDTGEILAAQGELRGERLAETIQKALAKKAGRQAKHSPPAR
jgi:peroxiredoxin